MSTVLLFPKAHVVIDAGTVSGSADPRRIGKTDFFVEYHDESGGVLQDYMGTSHAAAVEAAKGWDVPVYDRTTQGADH